MNGANENAGFGWSPVIIPRMTGGSHEDHTFHDSQPARSCPKVIEWTPQLSARQGDPRQRPIQPNPCAHAQVTNWLKDVRTEMARIIYERPIYPKNRNLDRVPGHHVEFRREVIDRQIALMRELGI
jgi:hypothetical protein